MPFHQAEIIRIPDFHLIIREENHMVERYRTECIKREPGIFSETECIKRESCIFSDRHFTDDFQLVIPYSVIPDLTRL